MSPLPMENVNNVLTVKLVTLRTPCVVRNRMCKVNAHLRSRAALECILLWIWHLTGRSVLLAQSDFNQIVSRLA